MCVLLNYGVVFDIILLNTRIKLQEKKIGDDVGYSIRKVQDKDRESLSEICIETAIYLPIKNPKGRFAKAIALMYADYYAVCEKENCFVLVDENDNAKGYILCAPNFEEYKAKFKSQFGEKLKNIGIVFYLSQLIEFKTMVKYAENFPAHLHIDLLPECQGQGHGALLIDKLIDHLKTLNVKGVMLGCMSKNVGAIKFYSRLGFVEQNRTKNEVVMTKKLD